jgi:glycosyltransferase involved in cell wall biosynthesis
MHIGFVTTESPYSPSPGGGIAAYLRAVIPAYLDAGHRVSVFAGAAKQEEFRAEDNRVEVHHFRLPAAHWYASKVPLARGIITLPLRQLEWSASFYRRIARLAAGNRIDVLESTEAGGLFLHRIAPLVIRLHGSEYVFRKHTGLPFDLGVHWNDSLEALSAAHSVAITTPSQSQANEISKHRGWPANRVHVIPNPISISMLSAALKFSRSSGSPEPSQSVDLANASGTSAVMEPLVLYTGRLAPVKGIETLLEAARLVHNRNRKVTFVLAGPWQMPHSPATYGLELNHKSVNGVKWIGPQHQEQLIDWYQRASLFVMPSFYESFGISVVEAMAFGLPIVASDSGSLSEVIGNQGLLVPRGDPEALANGIIDRMLWKKNDTSATQAAIERFHPHRVAAETINLYERVRREVSPTRVLECAGLSPL